MDRKKLHSKIVEHGYNIRSFAKKMGVNYAYFWTKLRRNTKFTENDILAITEALPLTLADKEAIFFGNEVKLYEIQSSPPPRDAVRDNVCRKK